MYADDQYLEIPGWLPAGRYAVLLGIREFPGEAWIPVDTRGGADQFPLVEVAVSQ